MVWFCLCSVLATYAYDANRVTLQAAHMGRNDRACAHCGITEKAYKSRKALQRGFRYKAPVQLAAAQSDDEKGAVGQRAEAGYKLDYLCNPCYEKHYAAQSAQAGAEGEAADAAEARAVPRRQKELAALQKSSWLEKFASYFKRKQQRITRSKRDKLGVQQDLSGKLEEIMALAAELPEDPDVRFTRSMTAAAFNQTAAAPAPGVGPSGLTRFPTQASYPAPSTPRCGALYWPFCLCLVLKSAIGLGGCRHACHRAGGGDLA